MPSRGAPWRGVGKGQKDRIGTEEVKDDTLLSEDIKDGTIAEVDLNSALQAKVNQAGGHVIEDEGTPLSQRPNMNFIGAGVTASDDGETTNVTIPGGGGSLSREEIGSPNDDFWIYDEFFYPTATDIDHLEHTENILSVPGTNTGGIIQQGTTSVTGNDTKMHTCGAGLATIDGTKKLILRWRAKLNIADENTGFICGLTKPNDGPQAPFPYVNKPGPIIVFFWDGVGNIDTYSDDGAAGVEQTDTGVAGDTAFHTYDIEFDPAGTPTITYKIDGTIVKTQTTNIPQGNFVAWIGVQTGSASVKQIQIDSWFLYNQR